MDLKKEIAKSVEAIKTASVEESSIEAKAGVYYGHALIIDKSTSTQLKRITAKIEELTTANNLAWRERLQRIKTTEPFFDRLRKAGLMEGNVWKGTKLQAGFAAYLFTLAFKNEGKPDKNGKQHDKYYQAEAQFSKIKGIKWETVKRYISYAIEEDANGIRYYNHMDEIEAVKNAFK